MPRTGLYVLVDRGSSDFFDASQRGRREEIPPAERMVIADYGDVNLKIRADADAMTPEAFVRSLYGDPGSRTAKVNGIPAVGQSQGVYEFGEVLKDGSRPTLHVNSSNVEWIQERGVVYIVGSTTKSFDELVPLADEASRQAAAK